MSKKEHSYCVGMVKRIGPWMAARWMRNRGVEFNQACVILLGRPGRL